ncbi:hypothetical protein BDV23DRAFT_189353 [Aspergillus alliaceus]|uniref:Uncharacterized protein n=1 Tax=Petromyces alliaceus TaxID=209559 RepID=A0A5N6FGL2_PETAA|nr:uncharacterized protein BDW43DRAFT_316325 [Aspergillus alliaceus]KAB8228020.1 hypothetical protein BDW43DRAFT_316325 [Aspergillus alliaceus]KAE8384291.1 hypothetical protein BDV23DRAFT_189353 [Aspergillus alliaceus]
MSSLNLHIDENDPDVKDVCGRYSRWKAFCILKRYLEPDGDLSLEQAAQLITRMLPTSAESNNYYINVILGHDAIDVAQQIHYSNPAQARLVRLLERLQISQKLIGLDNGELHEQYVSLSGVVQFSIVLYERYNFTESITADEEGHYVNSLAFFARLCTSGLWNSVHHAVWTMRENLEEGRSEDIYSECICGSAVWILCAGQWLFNQVVREPIEIDNGDRSLQGGRLYTGPELGMERWNFWQTTFAAAVEGDKANDEAKALARKCVNVMECLARDAMW